MCCVAVRRNLDSTHARTRSTILCAHVRVLRRVRGSRLVVCIEGTGIRLALLGAGLVEER
jgi:hypothetical protein